MSHLQLRAHIVFSCGTGPPGSWRILFTEKRLRCEIYYTYIKLLMGGRLPAPDMACGWPLSLGEWIPVHAAPHEVLAT